jgi:hypothetical protein
MDSTECIKKEWDFLKPLKTTLKCKSVLNAATDSEGSIYITGAIQDDSKEGAHQFPSNSFLGKYTCNGEMLWLKPVSTSCSAIARSIALDIQGNVYVTGFTRGMSKGGDDEEDKDIFIAKYWGSDGQLEWSNILGTKAEEEGMGIAVDSECNVYITGYTRGELKKGALKGAEDIFIARYSSEGQQEWLEQLGTWVSDAGLGIAVDNKGNVYITGYTQDHLKENAHKGGEDIFIARYSSDGQKEWLEQLGTKASDLGLGIAVDSFGNVYVTGYTAGDFNNDTENRKGHLSVFLARYSKNGYKQRCEEQLNFPGPAEAKNITTDSEGNVYISGYIRSPRSGAKKRHTDIFLAIFFKSGERQCITLNASWCDETSGIAIDNKGCVYFVGVTNCEIGEAKKGDIILAKYSGD